MLVTIQTESFSFQANTLKYIYEAALKPVVFRLKFLPHEWSHGNWTFATHPSSFFSLTVGYRPHF